MATTRELLQRLIDATADASGRPQGDWVRWADFIIRRWWEWLRRSGRPHPWRGNVNDDDSPVTQEDV